MPRFDRWNCWRFSTHRKLAISSTSYPEGPAIGHTNHYLAPELRDTEYLRAGSIGGSLARYTALRRFLQERGDRLTVEALMELTRNHTSYPRSTSQSANDASVWT